MIPAENTDFDFTIESQPNRTYRLNEDTQTVAGYCDGLDAIRQAVYKILFTERYRYVIYSWNYGVELEDLFGQPIPFVYSEIKRRITEALLQDTRITDVDNFQFSRDKGKVHVVFDVITTEGPFQAERTVSV